MRAQEEAVVRGEDDEGVAELALGVELLEDAAQELVDRLQAGAVAVESLSAASRSVKSGKAWRYPACRRRRLVEGRRAGSGKGANWPWSLGARRAGGVVLKGEIEEEGLGVRRLCVLQGLHRFVAIVGRVVARSP